MQYGPLLRMIRDLSNNRRCSEKPARVNHMAWAGVFLAALIGGCAQVSPDIRQKNASNIGKLELGMSREEVFRIMGTGTETVTEAIYLEQRLVDYADLAVSNPYRSEIREAGGHRFEILYYYAMPNGMGMGYWDTQFGEGTVPDWFLTPVVLKNGVLVGWGAGAMETAGLAEDSAIRDKFDSLSVGS